MLTPGRRLGSALLLVCITVSTTGCRDDEPPPFHNRDLGGEGVLLLPTASVWHDPAIVEGKADWHPFREPALDAEAEPGQASANARRAGKDQVEAQIRELIAEYNDLVPEATVDDLLEYYVEEQHDALRLMFEASPDFAKVFGRIRAELEARLPDAKGRIDAAFAVLEAGAATRLPVGSITVVSDTEAAASMAPGWIAPACSFRLLDEAWYVEIPGLADPAQFKRFSETGLTQYRGWLDGLLSGQVSPDAALQHIEGIVQSMKEAHARLDADGSGEGGDTGRAAMPATKPPGDKDADGGEDAGGG